MPPTLRLPFPILLALLLLSGCLGASGGHAPSATTVPTLSPSTTPGRWSLDLAASPTYTAANGVPFQDITVASGCGYFPLVLPEGTSRITAVLSGSAMDPAHGVGFLTMQMHAKGQPWIQPADTTPSWRTELSAQDPAAGDWAVWAWPNGPVANLAWSLQVHLEGTGPQPDVAFTDPGAFC